MPTISQLPSAVSVAPEDALPISQAGTLRATSVATLLASTQPAIMIEADSLLGRTSLGPGGPEQVDLGVGLIVADGTLSANGSDHSGFPTIGTLSTESDVVISNLGHPMRMRTSLLRGLFSAGANVTITPDGVISAAAQSENGSEETAAISIASRQRITNLNAEDLVAVSHADSDMAISYGDLLGGVTIDQAQRANAVADSDTIWAAQDSNVMVRQDFSSVWQWISKRLLAYKAPVIEITADTQLDTTIHNGCILVCSQPITLTPLTANMGSGFHCTVINASLGQVILGSGFISSTGSLVLTPWQSASLKAVNYSNGMIAFAAISGGGTTPPPGQVLGLSGSSASPNSITTYWLIPATGGPVSAYIVQFRVSGTAAWSSSGPIVGGVLTYQISNLQPGTNYDIIATAMNANGSGISSALIAVATSKVVITAVPSQVLGLTAMPQSSNSIGISWMSQSGPTAASSFTVLYKRSGSLDGNSTLPNLGSTNTLISGLQPGTSYEITVFGLNDAGAGPLSSVVISTTLAVSQAVSLITWNLMPAGTYASGSGSIGMNAHVSPSTSPVQFGFSLSNSTPPSSWTTAILVNTDLWGAYVPTPSTPGNYYAWAEGTDGSAPLVASNPILVT